MATPAQIAANKLNAEKSTGPQTPEGKAKSAMNRLTHGFCSPSAILPGEDSPQLLALIYDLTAEFQPATTTEEILVEKMAQAQWLTQRALNLQGEAFAKESGTIPKNLGLLIRYHNSAERAFHKAHNELVKTQKERKMSEIGFVPQESVEPVQTPPEPRKTIPEVITEDFIMNEPDLDLVEEALRIHLKAA